MREVKGVNYDRVNAKLRELEQIHRRNTMDKEHNRTDETVSQAIPQLAEQLGLTTPLGRKSFEVFCECAILLDQKNRDYGPGNISAFGEKGVIVRLNDKVERLKTLVWGDKHPEHEKVSDTWLDIANYGVIGLLCHRGEWK
jgi:hypothetical protein